MKSIHFDAFDRKSYIHQLGLNLICRLSFIQNNVLIKLVIRYRQYTESCRHNETFD